MKTNEIVKHCYENKNKELVVFKTEYYVYDNKRGWFNIQPSSATPFEDNSYEEIEIVHHGDFYHKRKDGNIGRRPIWKIWDSTQNET